MRVCDEAAWAFRPHLKTARTIAEDQFGPAIPVQVNGGNAAQRLCAADDVRAARGRQPDANDPWLVLVDRDMVAAAIGIQIGEQPPMASLRSRHEQQRTEAYERQRPDDARSRGHAGGVVPRSIARAGALPWSCFGYGISANVQTEPPAGTASAA